MQYLIINNRFGICGVLKQTTNYLNLDRKIKKNYDILSYILI